MFLDHPMLFAWVFMTVDRVHVMLHVLTFVLVAFSVFYVITVSMENGKLWTKAFKSLVGAMVFFGFLNVILPTQATLAVMIGSSMAADVYKKVEASPTAAKALQAVDAKVNKILDEMIDEGKKK